MNVEKTEVKRISRRPCPKLIIIDQKQLHNMEYLGGMINDARCVREIKSRTALIKTAFNKRKILLLAQ
jgi:hypothetical protein